MSTFGFSSFSPWPPGACLAVVPAQGVSLCRPDQEALLLTPAPFDATISAPFFPSPFWNFITEVLVICLTLAVGTGVEISGAGKKVYFIFTFVFELFLIFFCKYFVIFYL